MNKIEQLQQALRDADERDMVHECVEVLRLHLPSLLECAQRLADIERELATHPECTEGNAKVHYCYHRAKGGLKALMALDNQTLSVTKERA